MRRLSLALLLLVAAPAVHAQESGAPPPTKWTLTVNDDETPNDGRHIGISWDREGDPFSTVVVFRRMARPEEGGNGGAIHVVDQQAQIAPMFMYPGTYKTKYYPSWDASTHAIPPGTQLGQWTVVASFDGDPAHPIIDTVEPGFRYIYALVPAERSGAPDTYESLVGDAIVTPPLEPRPPSLIHRVWFQAVLGALAVVVIAAGLWLVKRRRRAGATTSAEAS